MDFMSRISEPSDDENQLCGSLSWQNRMYGFGACFVVGAFLSVFGSIELWLGQWAIFAFLYTLGTLTALVGTFFLRGPKTQFQKMFDRERIFATIALIASIILTIIVAIIGIKPLALFCCVFQFLAFFWYTLTYIPGGVAVVKGCFARIPALCRG